ncbi:MAG: TIGR02221 family CRISPR-associated protein [Syntrophus sp. (in: bacteria)]|nr:TIGR02221 family CRISPR-associated protein [Syntrophus sp. (in: bacteria)]
MTRILVAFLGKAQYSETMYQIDDKGYKESLAFKAISSHHDPIERTYIVGTSESSWDLLTGFVYEPVIIPYGRTAEEFWETFDILAQTIDAADSEVIFDFTHGFRVLPLFAIIYVRFLRYWEPSARLTHIYYGSFERGQTETPVVDLAPFIDLLDWIDAANAFIEHGELEALARKVKAASDSAYRENRTEKPGLMGAFSKKLVNMSEILRLTYTPMLSQECADVTRMLSDPNLTTELKTFVKPFSMLLGRLSDTAGLFQKPTTWESHLEVAKWYYRNKRFTQAFLVLRESIITYLCENNGCDPYSLDERERVTDHLNEASRSSSEPIHRLWNKVREARNNVGHAFMKQKNDESTPAKVAGKIEGLIANAETIFRGTKYD